jgi:hypothetical protein
MEQPKLNSIFLKIDKIEFTDRNIPLISLLNRKTIQGCYGKDSYLAKTNPNGCGRFDTSKYRRVEIRYERLYITIRLAGINDSNSIHC